MPTLNLSLLSLSHLHGNENIIVKAGKAANGRVKFATVPPEFPKFLKPSEAFVYRTFVQSSGGTSKSKDRQRCFLNF